MKTKIKQKWLAALRSGQYAQAKGALCKSTKNGDAFCCLGVLTQLAVEEGVIDGWVRAEGSRSRLAIEFDEGCQETDSLTDAVANWAGLDSGLPVIVDDTSERSLADLNDGTRGYLDGNNIRRDARPSLKFPEIADLIEKFL